MAVTWEAYSKPHGQRVFELGGEQDTPGYVTVDGGLVWDKADGVDFGSDGDDTIHTPLPQYSIPFYVQSTLIPPTTLDTDLIDLVFTNFSSPGVLPLPSLPCAYVLSLTLR